MVFRVCLFCLYKTSDNLATWLEQDSFLFIYKSVQKTWTFITSGADNSLFYSDQDKCYLLGEFLPDLV